jgi:hypothetical protein
MQQSGQPATSGGSSLTTTSIFEDPAQQALVKSFRWPHKSTGWMWPTT